jgi:hypothetical protein
MLEYFVRECFQYCMLLLFSCRLNSTIAMFSRSEYSVAVWRLLFISRGIENALGRAVASVLRSSRCEHAAPP